MGRPIVWVTVAFAGGILLAERHPLPVGPALSSTVTLYVLWLAGVTLLRGTFGARVLPALSLAAFAGLGLCTALADPAVRESAAATAWDGRRVTLHGLVVGPVERDEERQRARVRVAAVARRPTGFTVQARFPPTPPLAYGDELELTGTLQLPPAAGNPGEADLRTAFRKQGVAAFLRVSSRGDVRIVRRGRGSRLTALALRLRDRMVRPLLTLSPPYGGVLAGLLLGTQAGTGPEMEEVFLRAGLLHVLVVSGAQVALVAGAALAVTGVIRAPPPVRAGAAAAIVLAFSTMVGWSPSVGRATLMALVSLGAVALRRQADSSTTLALAALIWLAAHPATLFSLGFQLSFAATWGLLVLAPALRPALRPAWLAELMAVTFGAQIAVLPVLAVMFQRLSVAAFPANLLVLPMVAAVVPAGFALAAAGVLLPGPAAALAPGLLPLVWAIVAVARVFAAAPGAVIWLPPFGWWHAVAAYAGLASIPGLRRRGFGLGPIVLWAFTASGLLWVTAVLPAPLTHPPLTVAVLDVGQGEAILVRGPTGRSLLIDAGGEIDFGGGTTRRERGEERPRAAGFDIGERRVVPALRRMGVRRLDAVILSHPHEDHVGGLPAVLRSFPVGFVLDPGVPHPSPSYRQFLQIVARRRIPYRLGRRGQRLDVGDGARGDVLWPDDAGPARLVDRSLNNNSIVVRLVYGAVSFLLTGEIERETEDELLRTGVDLRSTVLKVAHHGSRTSTTPPFLSAVRPAVAVISVGYDNPFGHPHVQTLRTLQSGGVRVYRTDRDGAVLLHTDGYAVRVETFRGATVQAGAAAGRVAVP